MSNIAAKSRSHLTAKLARALWRSETGSILTLGAFATPVLVGILGAGVDAGVWYVHKRQMQTAADAAALSGAYERAKGSTSNIASAARREAIRNGFLEQPENSIVVRNPPQSGAFSSDSAAVEVTLANAQPLYFAKLFLQNVAIRTRAVAAVQTTGTACVLALHPTASEALTNSGNVTVNMPGCVMAANSTSNSAIRIGGSAQVSADSLWTAGNYQTGGSADLTLTRPPVVNAWTIDDPYADLLYPVTGSCKPVNSYVNQTASITAGTYCGGLNIGANAVVTFQPGTYYVNAGDFSVASNATVRCDCAETAGVTIVLTSDSVPSTIGTVVINGGADVQLKAPSDGLSTYSGLVFYQDPRAPESGADARFNGGALMNITGSAYFSTRRIQWNGNNSPSGPSCTQIIGRTVVFTGNATINNSGCPAAGVQPITITGVRIVE